MSEKAGMKSCDLANMDVNKAGCKIFLNSSLQVCSKRTFNTFLGFSKKTPQGVFNLNMDVALSNADYVQPLHHMNAVWQLYYYRNHSNAITFPRVQLCWSLNDISILINFWKVSEKNIFFGGKSPQVERQTNPSLADFSVASSNIFSYQGQCNLSVTEEKWWNWG